MIALALPAAGMAQGLQAPAPGDACPTRSLLLNFDVYHFGELRGQTPIWQLGDAFIVALPAEAHSPFQMALRQRFPHNHIAVLNIANGYLSYIPPRADYARSTYQSKVALYKAGAAEEILGSVTQTIEQLLEKSAARSR